MLIGPESFFGLNRCDFGRRLLATFLPSYLYSLWHRQTIIAKEITNVNTPNSKICQIVAAECFDVEYKLLSNIRLKLFAVRHYFMSNIFTITSAYNTNTTTYGAAIYYLSLKLLKAVFYIAQTF